ncbi:Hypothetical protein CINCED_3A006763 [Cinara cedri]|uniref:Uncharacterized protein n=1 Tax=Cinara cedri TaxID=506608 RepID=A0A5E4MLF2_9HEMI|nr:Hypothetical protein CINCED_3A006763 [Cinara cedri]
MPFEIDDQDEIKQEILTQKSPSVTFTQLQVEEENQNRKERISLLPPIIFRFRFRNQAEVADKLLELLASCQVKRWTETMEQLNFKYSSLEAWTLLRRLDPNPSHDKRTPVIKSNAFANH